MDNKITISNGDVVTLKTFITRGEFKDIQKFIISNGIEEKVSADNIDKMQANTEYALLKTISDIKSVSGESIKPSEEYINNLANNDFETLNKAANDIVYPKKTEDAKKA